MQFLHKREDAEDAVAETYNQAFKSLGSIREPKSVMGWLNTTVSRISMGMLPDKRYQREVSLDDEDSFVEPAAAATSAGGATALGAFLLGHGKLLALGLAAVVGLGTVTGVAVHNKALRNGEPEPTVQVEQTLEQETEKPGEIVPAETGEEPVEGALPGTVRIVADEEEPTLLRLELRDLPEDAGELSYRWLRDEEPIPEAVKDEYRIDPERDDGKQLRAEVASAHYTEPMRSDPVEIRFDGEEPTLLAEGEPDPDEDILTGKYFPDPEFLQCLQQQYPIGLTRGEAAKITELEIGMSIKGLDGIELFPELKKLSLIGSVDVVVESFDLHGNPKLRELYIWWSKVSKLDLSAQYNLEVLQCHCSSVEYVRFHPENLRTICFESHHLTSLDLSTATKLEDVCVIAGDLTELTLPASKNLSTVECYCNNLSALDVSMCPNLTWLRCDGNENLSTLNLEANTLLEVLNCDCTSISSMNLTNASRLIALNCEYTNISQLDLGGNPALTELRCSNARISNLDFSANPRIKSIYISGNPIASLDVSSLHQLEVLHCVDCGLTQLDVSSCPALRELVCSDNPIYSLSLPALPSLNWLKCSGCGLSTLDVSACSSLSALDCSNNNLATLDLSANGNLRSLTADSQTCYLSGAQITETGGDSLPGEPAGDETGAAEDGGSGEGEAPMTEPGPETESTTYWLCNLSDLVGSSLGCVLQLNIDGAYTYDPATGELRFEGSRPDSFTYVYDTGSSAGNMTVTVILS